MKKPAHIYGAMLQLYTTILEIEDGSAIPDDEITDEMKRLMKYIARKLNITLHDLRDDEI